MVINENIEDTNPILPKRAMGAAIYLAYEYLESKKQDRGFCGNDEAGEKKRVIGNGVDKW
ncbi:hypothetical protein [Candidatus Nitrospira allomarina]|uniref:Uncharacterized protein n=1 Tax=Candidatus Nitrospira allomarina TaxID=3020900 RepID=A0AA96GCR6_9BACT|nr:hypothetical protein [Candidatus Nitrospira allomarina]WNM56628.1 hypothetical protein PP769_11635 [Candidatus Nitrospira allomarina]